jgi:predicted RNA-binding protein (virulence factor B family)
LAKGDKLDGFIKTLREDSRLNIALTAPGPAKFDELEARIVKTLTSHDGFMAITDKSAPELIYQRFGISKKAFKQALGRLYKQRQIIIETDGIRLIRE